MSNFPIAHLPPLRFVKELLYSDKANALVRVCFDDIPSLAILIESAIQSSSGITDDVKTVRIGFLASLKNIKQLEKIELKEYLVSVTLIHQFNNFKSLSFEVLNGEIVIVNGSFFVVLE